jgi:3-hydroxyacyl-CoA dehydrogenase
MVVVGVIGAGTMEAGIGQLAAANGFLPRLREWSMLRIDLRA